MRKTHAASRAPRREPTHPGAVLRDIVLPELGIGVSEAARQLRVTRQALHRVLAGTAAVSPEMAARLGRFCGNGPEFWLRMQNDHDLWRVQRDLQDELQKIPAGKAA
jgi:antitoxin HigA-1